MNDELWTWLNVTERGRRKVPSKNHLQMGKMKINQKHSRKKCDSKLCHVNEINTLKKLKIYSVPRWKKDNSARRRNTKRMEKCYSTILISSFQRDVRERISMLRLLSTWKHVECFPFFNWHEKRWKNVSGVLQRKRLSLAFDGKCFVSVTL